MPQSPRKCTEFISTKNEKKSKKKCESFEVFHFKTLAYQQFNHSPEIFTYEKIVATSFATRQKVQMDSKYSVENGRGSEISKKKVSKRSRRDQNFEISEPLPFSTFEIFRYCSPSSTLSLAPTVATRVSGLCIGALYYFAVYLAPDSYDCDLVVVV